MPTLYTMAGTCALAPNIAIAWLDAPIEVKNIPYGEQKSQGFLAINPQGKVPVLQFEDGDVLTQAASILTYIGAEYGKEGWERDAKLGRKEDEALAYMTSEVHGAFGPHFSVAMFASSEDAKRQVMEHAYKSIDSHLRRLDATLYDNGGTWYLGRRSFADAFLYVISRWVDLTPLNISDYPALKAHRQRMEQDDAVKVALARQEMKPVG